MLNGASYSQVFLVSVLLIVFTTGRRLDLDDSTCRSLSDNPTSYYEDSTGKCIIPVTSHCSTDYGHDFISCAENSSCSASKRCHCNEHFTVSGSKGRRHYWSCIPAKSHGEQCSIENKIPRYPDNCDRINGLRCNLGSSGAALQGTCVCRRNQIWDSNATLCVGKESID